MHMNHKRKIELLAPGGDIDSIKAAIAAGADAVYCGLNKYNARNRAANITFEELTGILRLAHKNDCKVFLTLNIIFVDREFPDLIRLLNKLVNTHIDGVIIQDFGLFYLLSKHFKTLNIHGSTQLTSHNEGQLKFLERLGATRVNLSRELNIREIKLLTPAGHRHNLLTEIFIHGSYCISFSGICYFSSVQGGQSGNRGRCSQPCRDRYATTDAGQNFPLNLKDNSAYFDLKDISAAGVDSIKIEGRIKTFYYVYTVVEAYRKQLQCLYDKNSLDPDDSILYKVFNRDFSNSYLTGDISKTMFIDNPRNHSDIYLTESKDHSSADKNDPALLRIIAERNDLIADAKSKIEQLSIAKTPLKISISGKSGSALEVGVTTPDSSFIVSSESALVKSGINTLDKDSLLKRLKGINNTEYYIEHLALDNLHSNLFLPFKELTAIRNRILYILNGSREIYPPVAVPSLQNQSQSKINPSLSVLISSAKDVQLNRNTTAEIYFQLPNYLGNSISRFIDLFKEFEHLIPWFPSILIGKDYDAAIEFLRQLRPEQIVSNNTGIAFEANEMGISWIAGPQLNIINSYSLLCLKEFFNCSGAFISNEISKRQLMYIKRPADFKLFYSIYHPVELLTSRQCLFQQVTGCSKDCIDELCIQDCVKSASITNLNGVSFLVNKHAGGYCQLYNSINYLNTDIVADVPELFSNFCIDLRDINTNTHMECSKIQLVQQFENLIRGSGESIQKFKNIISPTTCTQYHKGI